MGFWNALVSSYALFAKGSTINEHLSSLGTLLPGGAMDIVRDQVDRVLAKGDVKLGTAFLISLLLAVWSANGGMKAVIDALNVAYEEKEERGFLRLNAVSLAFTFGGLIAILVAIGAIVALPLILAAIGLNSVTDAIIRYGRWPVLVLMISICPRSAVVALVVSNTTVQLVPPLTERISRRCEATYT